MLKEEVIQQAKAQPSGTSEELLVLKKKESLANAAAKASRDRANRLEDVSLVICKTIVNSTIHCKL